MVVRGGGLEVMQAGRGGGGSLMDWNGKKYFGGETSCREARKGEKEGIHLLHPTRLSYTVDQKT